MRHNFTLTGQRCRLRPLAEGDAAFILALRTNPQRAQHLHPTSPDLTHQIAWIDDYFKRDGDFYFVVEREVDRLADGLIALYDVDVPTASAEWGRWILRDGSLCAIESALLIYRFGFEILHLDTIFCRTLVENDRVVSFHDSCGIPERRLLSAHFDFCGQRHDAIEHRLNRALWPTVARRLQRIVDRLSDRI